MKLLAVLSVNNESSVTRFYFVTFLSLTLITISDGHILGLISQVATFGVKLKNNLDNEEVKDFEGVTTAIFRSLPIIGELWGTKSKSTSTSTNTLEIFENLSSKFAEVSEQLKTIKYSIQIAIFQKQVAENAREIDNCFEDYTRLLRTPEDPKSFRRLKKCQDNVKFGRNIANILKGETITFEQRSIYQEIISRKGYCDGKEITNVFKHLYGLYVKACASISMSEYLNSNNSQHTYNNECIDVNSEIFKKLHEVYLNCQRRSSCSKNTDRRKMEDIVKDKMKDNWLLSRRLATTAASLSEHFPWYFFTLLETKDELRKKSFRGSAKVPSMITIRVSKYSYLYSKKFVTVIWFPVKNNKSTTEDISSYELLLHQHSKYYNGINFSFTYSAWDDYFSRLSGSYLKSNKMVKAFSSCILYPSSKSNSKSNRNSNSNIDSNINSIVISNDSDSSSFSLPNSLYWIFGVGVLGVVIATGYAYYRRNRMAH